MEELETLGFSEILYGDGVTLIEWSDRADELPEDIIQVTIEIEKDNTRTIRIQGLAQ